MVQRGYLQSYASTSQRGETILPIVMPAPLTMKCQKLAAKRDHRGIRPNAAKAALEPHHAIIRVIGARWDCGAEASDQQANCKSWSLHAHLHWFQGANESKNPDQPLGTGGAH